MFKFNRLPQGYQELEYVESSGTQYIDSNFVATNKTRLVCDVQFTQQQDTASQFGSGNSGSNPLNKLLFGISYTGTTSITLAIGDVQNVATTLENIIETSHWAISVVYGKRQWNLGERSVETGDNFQIKFASRDDKVCTV